MSAARNIVSLLLIGALTASTAYIVYGLANPSKIAEGEPEGSGKWLESDIAPATVGNAVVVMFLLYTVATGYKSTAGWKLFSIFILIGGLFAELYMVLVAETGPNIVATYFVLAANWAIRMYYILDFNAFSWVSPFPSKVGTPAIPPPRPAQPSQGARPESGPRPEGQVPRLGGRHRR